MMKCISLCLALTFPVASLAATSVCFWSVSLVAMDKENKGLGVVLPDTFHDFKLNTGILNAITNTTAIFRITNVNWYPSSAGNRRTFQQLRHVFLMIGTDNTLNLGVLSVPFHGIDGQQFNFTLRAMVQGPGAVKASVCGTEGKPIALTAIEVSRSAPPN
jgi:hypothetical protein